MKIAAEVLQAVIQHAIEEYPIEACGYLAGSPGFVSESFPLKNLDQSAEHFQMDPAEQFQTARKIRELKHELLGVYHSHPHAPARPSIEDIRLAFDPDAIYMIVSLQGAIPAAKAFRIRDGQITEEPLKKTILYTKR